MVHLTLLAASLLSFLKNKGKPLIWGSFVVLFAFSALRYGYGNDYFSYLGIYNYIKLNGWYDYYEKNPLFILLNRFSPNFYIFVAVTSLAFLVAIFVLIYRNVSPKYQGIAVLLFVLNPYIFLTNLSAIRQATAMVVFVLAIYFSMKKKIVPYILLILVASMIHTSAILLLPIYFVANTKKISRPFLFIFTIIVALLVLSPASYDWFVGLFEEFLAENRYDRYIQEQGNSIYATIMALVYFVYVALNIRKLDGKKQAFAKLYLISTTISLIAYKASIFTRLDIYFIIFGLITIPNIIEHNVKNEKRPLPRFINVYLFPAFILLTYAIKYYNFFTEPNWASYRTYETFLRIY